MQARKPLNLDSFHALKAIVHCMKEIICLTFEVSYHQQSLGLKDRDSHPVNEALVFFHSHLIISNHVKCCKVCKLAPEVQFY